MNMRLFLEQVAHVLNTRACRIGRGYRGAHLSSPVFRPAGLLRAWSAEYPNDIRPGNDERLVGLEVADQNRRVLRRDHRREEIDWRGRVNEWERRLHDGLDRLDLDVVILHELGVEMRFVERPDHAPVARDGELREIVLAHDPHGVLDGAAGLNGEELSRDAERDEVARRHAGLLEESLLAHPLVVEHLGKVA